MKVAIFENYLDNIGGSEKVSFILAREFGGDIYTTNIDENKIRKMGFEDINVKSIGKVPINAPLRQQIVSRNFKKLNLRGEYDFFIVNGNWTASGALNNKPNIWYVNSPIRELWDLYEYTRKNIVPWFMRPMFDLWVRYNRSQNKKHVAHINKVISNSINTQKRIKQIFGRDSVVLSPPVETSRFFYKKNGDYWLSVNRLITYKRVELQMKAFSKMPDEKLIVVGSYEKASHFQKYADYIKRIKPENVELISWIEQEKLVDLYANCKGFITTSKDEDFGMNAIEAMASGKPVIAPNEGGYKETIINGKTGILIDDINPDKIVTAIKEISKNPGKYKDACIKQAKKFDTEIFIKKIKEQIKLI